MPIPTNLPPASCLADLFKNPGQWHVLAYKLKEDQAHRRDEEPPAWQYHIKEDGLPALREEILRATESNRVFAPQRALEDRIEWLAYAFLKPPSTGRKILPRPSSRIFGLG